MLARAGARTVLVDLEADLLTHKTSTLMAISRVLLPQSLNGNRNTTCGGEGLQLAPGRKWEPALR